MKTFFKNLEYCFLVESINTENASFPYKTAIPEALLSCTEVSQTHFFPVSIIKSVEGSQLDFKKQYL